MHWRHGIDIQSNDIEPIQSPYQRQSFGCKSATRRWCLNPWCHRRIEEIHIETYVNLLSAHPLLQVGDEFRYTPVSHDFVWDDLVSTIPCIRDVIFSIYRSTGSNMDSMLHIDQ